MRQNVLKVFKTQYSIHHGYAAFLHQPTQNHFSHLPPKPPNLTRASTPLDRRRPTDRRPTAARPLLLPTAGQKEQEANNWLEKRYKTDANPALSYDDTVQLALGLPEKCAPAP